MRTISAIIVVRRPTLNEYRKLRDGAGWHSVEDSRAQHALEESVFCVLAEVGGEAVGMARVVSDRGLYFYVHDVMVLPSFRKMGIATSLLRNTVDFFDRAAPRRSGTFLALAADPHLEEFYARFGFQRTSGKVPMLRRWRHESAQGGVENVTGLSVLFGILLTWYFPPSICDYALCDFSAIGEPDQTSSPNEFSSAGSSSELYVTEA